MRVHLILPAIGQGKNVHQFQGSPPLGLAYIAACLEKAGHKVRVTDAILEGWDHFMPYGRVVARGLHNKDVCARVEAGTDVIGISIMSTICWPLVIDLCDRLKKTHPEALIVLGGEHPTALPEFCLRTSRADVVVRGEGEETIVDLVRAACEDGREALGGVPGIAYLNGDHFIMTNPRPRIKDLDDLPYPAWHLFDVEGYQKKRFVGASLVTGRRSLPMLASRGCPHRCTFCTAESMWGRVYAMRAPEAVVEEMAFMSRQYGVTDFAIYDLTMGLKRDWMERFASLILERGLDVVWQMTTRLEVLDDRMAELLHRAGLRMAVLAPESGSARTRERIGKKMSNNVIERAIRACVRAGISTRVQIMTGLPGDGHADALANVRLAAKLGYLGCDGLGCAIFAPYPGTVLFRKLMENGQMVFDDAAIEFTVDNNQFAKPLLGYQTLSPWMIKLYQLMVFGTFIGNHFFFHPARSLVALKRAIWPDFSERDYFEKMLKMIFEVFRRLLKPLYNAEPIPWPRIDYKRFSVAQLTSTSPNYRSGID